MAVVPAEIEGMVTVKPVLNGNTATMTVMGVAVVVPRQTQDPDLPTGQLMPTPIKTPTKTITLEELVGNAKFNGRAEEGFDKATAIVEGDYDTATKVLTATGVEIEPAENLLLGALTSINPLTINDVPVLPITDARMKFEGFTNEFGFQVTLNQSLVGTAATAEGYFVGGTFYAHLIEVDASAPMVPGQKPVAFTRQNTRSRPGGPASVDIRGGVDFSFLPGFQNMRVVVSRMDVLNGNNQGVVIGIVDAVPDGAFPRFGLWRLQGRLTQPRETINEPFPLTAPRKLRAVTILPPPNNNLWVEEDADVRF
jgi:hypothetical protein